MTLVINGQTQTVPERVRTLPDLLEHLDMAKAPVVAELNQIAIPPAQQGKAFLADGDKLELVRITAGG